MNAIDTDRLPAEIRANLNAQTTPDFDLNDAIAEGEAIAERSAEIEADPDLAADLAIMEAAAQEREPVELACFSPDEGKTTNGGYSNDIPPEEPAPEVKPRIDIKDTAARALVASEAICRHWLPEGKRQGHEWVSTNPTRADKTPGSFSVNLDTGKWADFATDDKGGDLVSLVAYLEGTNQGEAARVLAEWLGCTPVVETAPKATQKAPKAMKTRPTTHPKLGKPSAQWDYLDADGRVLCAVMRFETKAGKEFRPITQTPDGWIWKAPSEPRPLYGLDRLAKRHPEAPVILCEGEKAADAAARLLCEFVHVASMNGAKSPARSDWSPLKGRVVRIWPDNDAPGAQFAQTAARLAYEAGAQSVEILDLSSLAETLPPGWDAADALAEGWTPRRFLECEPRWRFVERPEANTRRPIEPEREPGADTGPTPTDHTPPPWFGKIPPSGWKLTRNMVFEVKEKQGDTPDEYIPTCGPLWVVGRTTGAHGQWGLVLGFLDHNGHEQRLALPAARLHGDPSALVGDLSEMGLKTLPGREKKTLAYLGAWDVDERILSAKRLGWLEDPTGALAFVMPDHVIGRDGNRELVYQPDRYSPTVKTVHATGSLEQWQAHVARPAGDHEPMLFALCAGLAPALLAFAEGADSYVVHFWGKTSKGKTTLGQIAASPWGCAADPADAPSLAFIRRWNLTGNGLEGLAEAHSDLPLVLDELGAATVGDIRPLVYQLAGGQGKTAMNSAREMREPRSWRTIAISTGEMSLHARMSNAEEDGKRPRAIKGGLTHRALDVEVSDIAGASPREQREALVSSLKQACARFYGTAGPEFVRRLAARFGTMAEARAHVRALVEIILSEMATPGLPTETRRALRRFALIAAAGELASELDVLPVAPADIRSAAQMMARSWLSASAETDEQRIIASVRAFILAHESRFQRVNEPPRFDGSGNPIKPDSVRERVGFVDGRSGLWWFTDAGLIEAAPGHDKTTIARTLRATGHLFTNEKQKLTARASFEVEGKRPWLYAIKSAILDEETAEPHKSPGQPGQPGQAQQPQGFEAVPVVDTEPGQPGREAGTNTAAEPVPVPSVPVVPVGTEEPGRAEAQQPRGFVPVVPAVPAKNTITGKNPTGDAGANDDDTEAF